MEHSEYIYEDINISLWTDRGQIDKWDYTNQINLFVFVNF